MVIETYGLPFFLDVPISMNAQRSPVSAPMVAVA